jgi:hypothetical protein
MGIKIETAGFGPAAEVMIFEGKTPDGEKFGRQGFKNTLTGQLAAPEKGWDGEPPKEWAGDLACARTDLEKYRQGYEKINWHTGPQNPS